MSKHLSNKWMIRSLAILAGASASLFYLYDFLMRVMPTAMTHELMRAFHIQAAGLGVLAAAFFFGYAPMQIPAGMLYDRFRPKTILSIATLLCAVATLIFCYTTTLHIAIAARFLIGILSAFAYIGALKVGANWFKAQYFAVYIGLVQALGCLGAIIGTGPIASLTEHYGIHEIGLGIALLGVLFAIISYTCIRHRHQPAMPELSKEKAFTFEGVGIVFRNLQVSWAALYGFAIWAPITVFAVLWGVPFLMTFYSATKVEAAYAITFIWVGVAIGGPVIGWWTNHIKSRRIPMITACSISLLSICMILFVKFSSMALLYVFLTLLGFGASSQLIPFALLLDNLPHSAIGTGTGLTNMAVIFGGVTLQPIVGFILKYLWTGKLHHGIAIYSAAHFQMALSVVIYPLILALLVALFLIKETHCQQKYPRSENQI